MDGITCYAESFVGETGGENVSRDGRYTPTNFSAALTMHRRVLQQVVMQEPYHTVMQLVRTLSVVPMLKGHMIISVCS